jgi:hypothetical protein
MLSSRRYRCAARRAAGKHARATGLVERTERRRTHFPGREFLFDYYRQRDIFRNWRDDYLWAYIDHGHRQVEGGIERLAPGWVEGKLLRGDGRRLRVARPFVPGRGRFAGLRRRQRRLAAGRDRGPDPGCVPARDCVGHGQRDPLGRWSIRKRGAPEC